MMAGNILYVSNSLTLRPENNSWKRKKELQGIKNFLRMSRLPDLSYIPYMLYLIDYFNVYHFTPIHQVKGPVVLD